MGATTEIAEFACKTKFEDFDPALVKHVKDVFLSGLGMTLPGAYSGSGSKVLKYVKECAAPEEAGVIGAGFRTSAELAALANGTTSHSTELEDDTWPDLTFSVGVFPAVFALGEKLHISGKDAITAFITGWDVASKAGLSSLPMVSRGFQAAVYNCTLGVAALSAKLLDLGLEKTTMAVSIAASHACGLLKQTGTGAHLYESGLAGKNGITSALLAKHGLTGQPDILEMPMGLFDAVAGLTNPDLKLGAPYRAADIGIKRYPCCFLEMHPIYGVLELIKTYNIFADDVESIVVDIYPGFMKAVRFHHPKDEDEAKFSLPHSIACAFLDKIPWIDSYTNERVNDPKVRAFRDKVKMVIHPEWTKPGLEGVEVPITIRLKDGKEYKKVCPKPESPIVLTDAEIMDKYMNCATRVLSKSRSENIAEIILSLEKLEDISELMTLLTFPDKKK